MLPTHGAASGVFLLANAARYRIHQDAKAWTGAARSRSSFMAGAVDIDGCAQAILRLGLATISDMVRLDHALLGLSERADRPTLTAISALLLRLDPPPWMPLAVRDGVVFREYIPSEDLRDLEWLEPYLDQLLVEAAESLARQHVDSLREALGRAGELVVLAAATQAGAFALHVADVSDAYGYDIEVQTSFKQRLEVKSTTNATEGTFHLSRNEFNRCRQYGPEWRLIQVTFDSSIFTDDSISASHVLAISELEGSKLLGLVPPDTAAFRWTESAVIQPPPDYWLPYGFQTPANLRLPSVRELASSMNSQI
ncbi:DUF3883 domain-containing protein [Pseudarthrobacter oxydans]|uniref:protein NO VEIN domain-containing protein n=1 Tax=Pseudarthrobacter oxydans TaxID=1671 RepID=UPI003ECE33EC